MSENLVNETESVSAAREAGLPSFFSVYSDKLTTG